MIGFLHPAWLWALPAAALPLILHLVARRQPPTVPFPAVRYLQQVTRDHQRRLKLQHWLLLLARTLFVLAVVLAAAAPTMARDGLAGHAPAALVLVLDNSPSSGAVTGGTPVLDRLRVAARGVLDKATTEDAVWLVTADGVARRAPIDRLRAAVTPFHRLKSGSTSAVPSGRPGISWLMPAAQARSSCSPICRRPP